MKLCSAGVIYGQPGKPFFIVFCFIDKYLVIYKMKR